MMAGTFDPYDQVSWFFGRMTRPEAEQLLNREASMGIFLVRDSTSIEGDLVLCVKEETKTSHYIINKIQERDQIRYRMGDQTFPDVPALLHFYKNHYLDTTTLIRPAKREKVRARYDFEARDTSDLPFRRGDVLTVLVKDEPQWWTAQNSHGRIGSIPVPFVSLIQFDSDEDGTGSLGMSTLSLNSNGSTDHPPPSLSTREGAASNPFNPLHMNATSTITPSISIPGHPTGSNNNHVQDGLSEEGGPTTSSPITSSIETSQPLITPTVSSGVSPGSLTASSERKLPCFAKVIQPRVPNAYDRQALRLQLGDVIKVTKMNISGQWEGELKGKIGFFPFNHVLFIEGEYNPEDESKS